MPHALRNVVPVDAVQCAGFRKDFQQHLRLLECLEPFLSSSPLGEDSAWKQLIGMDQKALEVARKHEHLFPTDAVLIE